MKAIKIASLILFFNALFGQVDYTLSIDKIHYGFGENIPISVTATNTQDTTVMLSWSDFCQATYAVDSVLYDYGCIQIPSAITLPPDSSFSWNFIYEGTDSLSQGIHYVQGQVTGYGNTPLFIIHVSDVDTSHILSFLPMQVGNRWQFYTTETGGGIGDTSLTTITIDTIIMIGDKKYYHFDPWFLPWCETFNEAYPYEDMFETVRIDTAEFEVRIGDTLFTYQDGQYIYYYNDFYILPLYMDSTIRENLYSFNSNHHSWSPDIYYNTELKYFPNFQLTRLDTSLESIQTSWGLTSYINLVPQIGIGKVSRFVHWSDQGDMYLIAAEINGITYGEFLDIDDQIIIPNKFSLARPYPNPFNPVINIDFTIPFLSKVSIRIVDILGKEVGVLLDEYKSPESYSIQWNAHNFSSGVYFIQMQAGEFIQTKKIALLK